MTQRIATLIAALALVGALFAGAPSVASATAITLYVGPNAFGGGSCAAPDYHVGGVDDQVVIQLAIDAASNGDTVYLCAGTYHLSGTLTGDDHTLLQGAGAGSTILDGGATFADGEYVSGGHRILDTNETPMSISDMTFTHGAAEGAGGAIYANDNLTISAVTFAENASYAGDEFGAGTICTDGEIDTTISDSTFTGNQSDTNGGAIGCEGGSLTIDNTTFSHNTSNKHGGAIDGHQDMGIVITNSVFEFNSTSNSGGAMEANGRGTVVTIRNTVFTGNHADDAGGALWDNHDTTISGSTFTGNHADGAGGALWGDHDTTISGSTFTGNTAGGGGAICTSSTSMTTNITSSRFINNTSESYGGAIACVGGWLTIDASAFSGNSAPWHGGAIDDHQRYGTTITNSTFTSNIAGMEGGAIGANGSDLVVRATQFLANISGSYGGAIWSDCRTIDVTKSRFRKNQAATDGGAVWVDGVGVVATKKSLRMIVARNVFVANRGKRAANVGSNLNCTD